MLVRLEARARPANAARCLNAVCRVTERAVTEMFRELNDSLNRRIQPIVHNFYNGFDRSKPTTCPKCRIPGDLVDIL